jgi:drug/metabolite transporter (DMT)-like permease
VGPAAGRAWRGDLALVACAAGWGLTFPLIGDAVRDDVSPFLFVGIRFSIAALVLLPLAWWKGRIPRGRALRDGLVVGLFVFAGFATQTLGLQTLSAARSAFLTSFYVLFTPLLAVLLTRARPAPAVLAGLALAFAGGVVLTGAGDSLVGGLTVADGLTLFCALAFAAQMVALSVMARRHGALSLAFSQSAVTALASLALAPFAEELLLRPTGSALFSLAFNGVVASALLLGLQAWGQRTTSASRAAVLFASEPVWATAFAFLIWAEQPGPRDLSGGALILAGILLAELWPAARNRRRVDPREGPG